MNKYIKPTIKTKSIRSATIICASNNDSISNWDSTVGQNFYVSQEVKDLYSVMTVRQKAAAMNLMWLLGAFCHQKRECVSEINKITTIAERSMGISKATYRSYRESLGDFKDITNELKNIRDKCVMDYLFLSFYSVVSVSKSKQAMAVLLKIYSECGYTEDDCLEILKISNTISRMF